MTNPIGANLVFPGFHAGYVQPSFERWNPSIVINNTIEDAIRSRAWLPGATIGLRNMTGGTDNEYLVHNSIDDWVEKWRALFPALREHRIHAVTQNEPGGYGDALTRTIKAETQIARILADEGIGGMFCRFPVGHPDDKRLVELLPLADAIRAYDKHRYTTNEYARIDFPLLRQERFVGRIRWLFDAVGPMQTYLGEISVNTRHPAAPHDPDMQDSASGFRSSYGAGVENIVLFAHGLIVMWEGAYMAINRDFGAQWIQGAAAFLVGGASNQKHQDLARNDDEWRAFVDVMADYRPEALPMPLVEQPCKAVVLVETANRRDGPGTNYKILGTAKKASEWFITGYCDKEDGRWWHVGAGYIRGDLLRIEGDCDEVEVLPPPPQEHWPDKSEDIIPDINGGENVPEPNGGSTPVKPETNQPTEIDPTPEEEATMSIFKVLGAALVIGLLLIIGIVTVLANVPATGVGDALAQQAGDAIDPEDLTTLFTADQSEQQVSQIVQALKDAVPISPFVYLVVQILKLLIPHIEWKWLQERKAPELAAFVGLIFVLTGALANTTGYADTFDNTAMFLDNLAPPLTTLLGAIGGSAGIFILLNRLGLGESFFGRSLTDEPTAPA